ncbi:hypothetical protein DV735_g940, partial [Chaetothyriales sp. CBS 134920]
MSMTTTVTASSSTQVPNKQDDVDVYDEIEIEDMTYDPALQIYHYPCPCGDRFEINIDSLRDGEEIAVYLKKKRRKRKYQADMTFTIRQIPGNLIDMASPSPSVILAHACNCKGQANAGLAKALKAAFPAATKEYSDFCKGRDVEEIIGSTVVTQIELPTAAGDDDGRRQFCHLANLLTSRDYGRRKDKAEMIVQQTEAALKDLRAWIEQQEFGKQGGGKVQVFSNKMNAGFFAVRWEVTLGVIKKVFADTDVEWTVVVVEDDHDEPRSSTPTGRSRASKLEARRSAKSGKGKVRAGHPMATRDKLKDGYMILDRILTLLSPHLTDPHSIHHNTIRPDKRRPFLPLPWPTIPSSKPLNNASAINLAHPVNSLASVTSPSALNTALILFASRSSRCVGSIGGA